MKFGGSLQNLSIPPRALPGGELAEPSTHLIFDIRHLTRDVVIVFNWVKLTMECVFCP